MKLRKITFSGFCILFFCIQSYAHTSEAVRTNKAEPKEIIIRDHSGVIAIMTLNTHCKHHSSDECWQEFSFTPPDSSQRNEHSEQGTPSFFQQLSTHNHELSFNTESTSESTSLRLSLPWKKPKQDYYISADLSPTPKIIDKPLLSPLALSLSPEMLAAFNYELSGAQAFQPPHPQKELNCGKIRVLENTLERTLTFGYDSNYSLQISMGTDGVPQEILLNPDQGNYFRSFINSIWSGLYESSMHVIYSISSPRTIINSYEFLHHAFKMPGYVLSLKQSYSPAVLGSFLHNALEGSEHLLHIIGVEGIEDIAGRMVSSVSNSSKNIADTLLPMALDREQIDNIYQWLSLQPIPAYIMGILDIYCLSFSGYELLTETDQGRTLILRNGISFAVGLANAFNVASYIYLEKL